MMVVEDTEDMRALIRLVVDLSDHGITVTAEATDAEEALRQWRSMPRPDVVLLDYRLPGRNGLDVAAEMLADDADLPIILFSAFLDDETIAAAYAIGVRTCVSKDDVRRLPDIVASHRRR